MRAYKVSAGIHIRLAASQADARAKRDELVDKFNFKKKDVLIEELELPTGKAELLPAINELLSAHDDKEA